MSYRETPVYIDNLLALRGLCALGVLLVHSLGASDLSFRHYVENDWAFGALSQQIVASLTPTTGKNFVLFFFVHSGYLMGKIFFMDRYVLDRAGIIRFYKSRFLRIAPLLYVNLAFCLLLVVSTMPTWKQALGDFLFINNFIGRNINGVTWSMSWEMQYYLVAPFVFMYFCMPSIRNLIWVIGLAVLFEILANAGITKYPPTEFMFYFLSGFAINLALRQWEVRKFRGSAWVAVAGGFFVGNAIYYVLVNNDLEPFANPLIGMASALTIYLLELPRADETAAMPYERYGLFRLLMLRFWTWAGILSYGIYLWHLPLLSFINDPAVRVAHELFAALGDVESGWQRMMLFHLVQMPAVLAATLAVSLLTFLTVEIRFRPGLYSWDGSRYVGRYIRARFTRRVASSGATA